MGSLAADSLFTNIQLEETIDIRTNRPFEKNEKVEALSKILSDFHLMLQKNRILFLTKSSRSKSVESLYAFTFRPDVG